MSIRNGLIAEYLFSGNAKDTSGHDRHGVVNGATLTHDRRGNANSAYRFNGVDNSISVAPAPELSAAAFSISVWANFDRSDLSRYWSNCIVSQDNGEDDDQSHRIFQLSTNYDHVVWHQMMQTSDAVCRESIRPGEWRHFVVTFEHNLHSLYVDGTLHDKVSNDFRVSATEPLYIGRKGSPEKHFYFCGAIDDVRIYNRALDSGDINELFHENGFRTS